MAKVMRKEARHTQRWDRASGVPLEILEHLPPKPESAYFTALCFHLHLWVYGELSPTTSFREGVLKSLSHVRLFGTPWIVAYQAPLSMGFSRQEYWSGLPFPSPRDLPNPGIKPRSPALQKDVLLSKPPGKPHQREEEVDMSQLHWPLTAATHWVVRMRKRRGENDQVLDKSKC